MIKRLKKYVEYGHKNQYETNNIPITILRYRYQIFKLIE